MIQEKREEKNLKTEEIVYTAAKAMLPVMMDEYTKERERAGIIDNKATFLLTILVALLTVYIPITPFEDIGYIYKEGSKNELICLVIACLLFLIAIVITIITFVKLIRVIQLQTYQRVTVQDIVTMEAMKVPEDEAERAMCAHYFELIEVNGNINDAKADRISNCFILTIISFLLLLCSTLILLLI